MDDIKQARYLKLNLIGDSPKFIACLGQIECIAACDAPALISGETGTGKELAARAIHYLGSRVAGPFIPVNCGAIPDGLLENELFGHVRGAYTDARNQQAGLVAEAHGGTLFLDEVDALSPKAQVTLLRFIQEKRFKPLGAEHSLGSDTRIVAASNTDLEQAVECLDFRRDLFFRLNVLPLHLPPLKSRREDIELLATHFLDKASKDYKKPLKSWDPQLLAWMLSYDWPGNIRELENFVHRTLLMSRGELLTHQTADTALPDTEIQDPVWDFNRAKRQAIENFERNYLTQLMEQTQGNVTRAADLCGKERRSLGKMLKKHGIDRIRFKEGSEHHGSG